MKKLVPFLCLLFTITICSSCKAKTEGNTLYSFIGRMNNLSDTYELNSNGYILDKKNGTLSHFYKFGENEILLQFGLDKQNNLTQMNIVSTESFTEDTEEFLFISNCISAFIDNPETEKSIFSEKSLADLLKKHRNETTEIKKGDTQLLLDVTDSGTVITVVKNSP